MNANIHDVTKINLGAIDKLSNNGYTRKIFFYSDSNEVLEITCFADEKKDLKIEVQETKVL